MNAHTNGLADYITEYDANFLQVPNDFAPINNEKPPRNNCDTKTCSDGKELMDVWIINDLTILNGRVLGDLFGRKTFHGKLGSSCVDYFLASNGIMPYVSYLKVNLYTIYSDHSPVTLSLHLDNGFNPERLNYTFTKTEQKFKWDLLKAAILLPKH